MKGLFKIKRTNVIALLCIGLLVISCSVPVQFGRHFAIDEIQKISPGLSDQEVRSRLGNPMATGRNKEGQQTWTWYYLQAHLPAKADQDPVVQRLTISFSEGKVVSTEYDMSEEAK